MTFRCGRLGRSAKGIWYYSLCVHTTLVALRAVCKSLALGDSTLLMNEDAHE